MGKMIRLTDSDEKIINKEINFMNDDLINHKLNFLIRDYLRIKEENNKLKTIMFKNSEKLPELHNSPIVSQNTHYEDIEIFEEPNSKMDYNEEDILLGNLDKYSELET